MRDSEAAMPCVEAPRCPTPSVRQLRMVFDLCDPHNTGKVLVDHLQELAKIYSSEDAKDLGDILKYFDPQDKGALSFREFHHGVRAVLKKRHLQERTAARESMMSPALDDVGRVVVATPVVGVPEPRFVVSAADDSPPPADAAKSQCSSLSDGESFECYGQAADLDVDSGISSSERNIGDHIGTQSPLNNADIKRHTWQRTSLRRSPPSHQENLPHRRWGSFRHSGKRQLGSNALASQLYRSSSFNSSGRSSTCDTADDMYSDVSLEDDVHLDINHKLQIIQQQMGVLTDSANQSDERYIRAKAENAALQARVHMLEEQLRESEFRHEERLQDEQRRAKELLVRVEREKQQQLENNSIRIQALELEVASLREEAARQKGRAERLEVERHELGDQVQDARNELFAVRNSEHAYRDAEKRLTQELATNGQLVEALSHEVDRLRAESRTPALPTTSAEQLRLEELHQEVAGLRSDNRALSEANEELQANLLAAGVEQGRLLTAGETSLAAELEAMSHDQFFLPDEHKSLPEIQQALKEQQEENAQLRNYINGMLLNILQNSPQLLEVKQKM